MMDHLVRATGLPLFNASGVMSRPEQDLSDPVKRSSVSCITRQERKNNGPDVSRKEHPIVTYAPIARWKMLFLLCACLLMVPGGAAMAAKAGVGPVTGLPLPRFASLKSDRINLREGPSKENKTVWIYQRSGLPIEITAEFETWRRIRDSEGTEGWVLHSLLSGRRTALAAPWMKDGNLQLLAKADEAAPVVAILQPGVQVMIKRCDGQWCRVNGEGFDGYIQQERLWGAYPGEVLE
jgi:SH3-like domain-containing protein